MVYLQQLDAKSKGSDQTARNSIIFWMLCNHFFMDYRSWKTEKKILIFDEALPLNLSCLTLGAMSVTLGSRSWVWAEETEYLEWLPHFSHRIWTSHWLKRCRGAEFQMRHNKDNLGAVGRRQWDNTSQMEPASFWAGGEAELPDRWTRGLSPTVAKTVINSLDTPPDRARMS